MATTPCKWAYMPVCWEGRWHVARFPFPVRGCPWQHPTTPPYHTVTKHPIKQPANRPTDQVATCLTNRTANQSTTHRGGPPTKQASNQVTNQKCTNQHKQYRGKAIGQQQTEDQLEGAMSKLTIQPMFEPMTRSNEKASNVYLSMQIMLKTNHTGLHASTYLQRSRKTTHQATINKLQFGDNSQEPTINKLYRCGTLHAKTSLLPKPKQQTYWSR